MSLGPPTKRNEPIHVIGMAFALVVAAFLGAAIGLIWQSAGLGGEDEAAAPAKAD